VLPVKALSSAIAVTHRGTAGLVEDHAEHVLVTCKTQHEAIEWAKKNGHAPHVARVRHLNKKTQPDHWRAV
jgi:hypothetical protein